MKVEKEPKSNNGWIGFVDNQRCDKAGTEVKEDCSIEVKGNPIPYVSRGGLKLEKAMKNFDLTIDGKVCMDIGHPQVVLQIVCSKMEQ